MEYGRYPNDATKYVDIMCRYDPHVYASSETTSSSVFYPKYPKVSTVSSRHFRAGPTDKNVSKTVLGTQTDSPKYGQWCRKLSRGR